ncbi:MAG: hypothetical protein FJY81_03620 [Candidatus Aminicenantes bacterium]|nr:hypothetical protein [Candidatus Aminicenantes bacterium]
MKDLNIREKIKTRIMELMQRHRGKARAIPREELRAQINEWLRMICRPDLVLDDREFRKLYTTLPLCGGDPGLWWPETTEEVEEFRRYLAAKVPPWIVQDRIRRIYSVFPQLTPAREIQQELGI